MRLRREEPDLLDTDDVTQLRRLAVGRGLIDYVASLTDAQASSLAAMLGGWTERLWDAGQGL